ncbi:MAG: carboxylating nicotinate-nucleotide diphosphorylase [Gammaproteobacteria bacterium]|nr:carboxylating nicotinate-nucleotide diphosphorylase [Gammaproteobacteria bacterium]
MNGLVRYAIQEDVGSGDVTAQLIHADTQASAELICREHVVICGIPWAQETINQIDRKIKSKWLVVDGDKVEAHSVIARFNGPARSLLTAERTMLNFLQTLSSVATQTEIYVNAIKPHPVKILDTRKTVPGLRHAEKYAVRCGGGYNHRMGLFEAFLIKENHIRSAGSITAAIQQAHQQDANLMVEVEVENLEQLDEAIAAKPDRILLDNFTPDVIRNAVEIIQGRVELEASGNITLDNIVEYAATGVNYISVGLLTKDVQAVDLSLLFK